MESTINLDINIDLFKWNAELNRWASGVFIGQPFRITYSLVDILVSDALKLEAKGIPQGSFLLAYYNNPSADHREVILLRVIEPIELPQDSEIISSIIEYYKDSGHVHGSQEASLDIYTRYHCSFSGLRCSVLGCFYEDADGKISFGTDIENFYSAQNYSIIKPSSQILEFIVNYKENKVTTSNDIKIGHVRYSSTQRLQSNDPEVPVYISANDFAGKRTALFGMTRTGKSNTAKMIIQAVALLKSHPNDYESVKYPIGQIIFDINGEYANPNLQDGGSAIFDMFKEKTIRYSTVPKKDFLVMKVNFYYEIEEGFFWIKNLPRLIGEKTQYIANFLALSFLKPEDGEFGETTRNDRKIAVYQCMLYRAGFKLPMGFRLKFRCSEEIQKAMGDNLVKCEKDLMDLDIEAACNWWEKLWKNYSTLPVFTNYKEEHEKEWADDDLKALLIMLTRKSKPGLLEPDRSGYHVIKGAIVQHTESNQEPYDQEILKHLRAGNIVIVDLSLGDEDVQRKFSERITQKIFNDSLERFTSNIQNNYIQFYFEEAHNLFPRKDDTDLSQIYNRLAKEGAKLNLGLVYATQEVSSISSNILKATQNWFISHLNNQDEIRELTKYYDFGDFTISLIKFSPNTDKGFAKMKTYSSAFVVPVQIDRFTAKQGLVESKDPLAAEEIIEELWGKRAK